MADLSSRITRPDATGEASKPEAVVDDAPVDAGPGLIESTYDVEVKLSDLQGDSDNPLSSVSSFEELGL